MKTNCAVRKVRTGCLCVRRIKRCNCAVCRTGVQQWIYSLLFVQNLFYVAHLQYECVIFHSDTHCPVLWTT